MEPLDRRAMLAGSATLLAGCPSPFGRDTDTGGTVTPLGETPGYPHLRPSGNRVAAGAGAVPDVDPVTVDLPATPTWLAAVPTSGGSLWAIADESETVRVLDLTGEASERRTRSWDPQRPPVLGLDGSVVDPPGGSSSLTPPLVLPDGRLAAVGGDGGLLLVGDRSLNRVPADLLADSRLCRLGDGRAVALGGPTDRYDHGALGDTTEASEVVVLDTDVGAVERRISTPRERVVEGTAPIVTEFGGRRAIVVTESGGDAGARLAAYTPDGDVVARGDSIGARFRWRHQLAVAPFGPGGRRELAVVKTPHIGGTVEFYAVEGDSLDIVATESDASSHALGDRNLDGAVAADADGDGSVELVVPDDERRRLRGIERRGDDSAGEAWAVDIGGRLSTNVVGVPHGSSGLAIGVGTGASEVRIWASEG